MQYIAGINKQLFFNNAKMALLSAILITIAFSILNLNSLCIILLSAAWLFEGNMREKLRRLRKDPLFLAYSLYFILQVLGVFIGTDRRAGWRHVESQLGFFIIPLILCSSPVSDGMRKKVMLAFTASLTIASLFCITVLTWTQDSSSGLSRFFYHSLVSPIGHHAVYFSVYVFICLLFLVYEQIPDSSTRQKWLYAVWVAYLILLLFLLSSKLMLSILLFFAIFYVQRHYFNKKRLWAALFLSIIVIVSVDLIVTTNNPVKARFSDVLQSNMDLLRKEKFNSNTSFTGLNLRLIFWRFTYEILNENAAFVFGVGPANAQHYLDQKYISMDMYQGNNRNDKGYLGYNCHNQFLQSALGSGITGVAVLIFWYVVLLIRTYKNGNPVLWGITLTIFLFFFSESVFNRQYGVILCSLIPLLYTKTSGRQPAPVIRISS